jgi:hypothetical protein
MVCFSFAYLSIFTYSYTAYFNILVFYFSFFPPPIRKQALQEQGFLFSVMGVASTTVYLEWLAIKSTQYLQTRCAHIDFTVEPKFSWTKILVSLKLLSTYAPLSSKI